VQKLASAIFEIEFPIIDLKRIEGNRIMKAIEITKAKSSLAEYAKEVRREPVVVTVKGKPVAALIAIRNADRETVSLSNNPRFLALIERSRKIQRKKGGISIGEMRDRLGIK
jgi:prevent-host-death family protein